MSLTPYSPRPFLLAASLVALAMLLRATLEVTFTYDPRYLIYLVAVVGAGAWGGLWPGLSATFLGGAAGIVRLLPGESPWWIVDRPELARFMTYVVLGVVVSLVCESLRRARQRVEVHARDCEQSLTARRRSEVLLSSVLDNVVDGIIGIDERGTIESFNRSAERLFGYRAHDILSRNVKVLMPEPYHSEDDSYIANCLKTGHPRIIGIGQEAVARRSDGTTFPVDLAVGEFVLDGARHFTGVVRDITEQRKLTEQLRQSQKMEAIGRLAGGVAHDFNNVLTVISGYAEMLVERLSESDIERPPIVAIADAAERAAALTRQLLAFSRQAVVEPKVLDLNVIVIETEEMLRRLVGEDVQLRTALDPRISRVRVDRGQVGQLLMNLAGNARDAMPRGGSLMIETSAIDFGLGRPGEHAATRRGRYVLLAVTDTGAGMTSEVKSHIFEPFFTTKSPGKGTGLGLATVYGIVRQSGGDIEVSSEIGHGTAFKIYLPAVEAGASVPADTPAVEGGGRGTETVLLVEDEEGVRTMALLALRRYGYSVLGASNGHEALQMLRRHPGVVDLMITDVVMPGMSGTEVADAARALRPLMKVLYVSGYTDDAVVRHGLLRADVEFLQKPYTPVSLSRKLRQVLARAAEADTFIPVLTTTGQIVDTRSDGTCARPG